MSFGQGLVRDIAEESIPDCASTPAGHLFPIATAVRAFLGSATTPIGIAPASPACALFRADVFGRWLGEVEAHSTATPLTRQLLWRRAIGPDLLLFLTALETDGGTGFIGYETELVTQFSDHAGSISVVSASWALPAGYWMARSEWLLRRSRSGMQKEVVAGAVIDLLLGGTQLIRRVPSSPLGEELPGSDAMTELKQRMSDLRRVGVAAVGRTRFTALLLGALFERARRRLVRND